MLFYIPFNSQILQYLQLYFYLPNTDTGEGNGKQPLPVFLPGESHGQRSLAGCGPWGFKELATAEVT